MALLKLIDGTPLRRVLAEITHPVTLRLASAGAPEPELLAALHDLRRLCPLVAVSTVPAEQPPDTLTVASDDGRELRFVGPPLGTELAALVSAVVVAGRQNANLPSKIKQGLAELNRPLHIDVFTTPT